MAVKTAKRWKESAYGHEQIDREAGVIRGVKILGLSSRNGRDYDPQAVRDAAPLYEGTNVYVDHPGRNETGERKLRDKFGWLENVRVDKDGGLRGDLHYLKSHPLSEMVLEAADRNPNSFGLSHNAGGEEKRRNGRSVVTEIAEVFSVDLVSDPATNKGLFEEVRTMKKVKLVEVVQANEKVAFAAVLKEMMGTDTMTEMGDYEMEVPEEMSAEDQIDAAFRSIVMAILDDESLDTQGKLDKIKNVLTAKDDAVAAVGGETPAEPTTDTGDEAMAESDKLKALEAQIANLKEEADNAKAEASRVALREECRKLLESNNREQSETRIKALMAVDQKDRKPLVESWPAVQKQSANRPERSPSILTEGVGSDSYPKDISEMRKRLR